jgi:hypothetical protein
LLVRCVMAAWKHGLRESVNSFFCISRNAQPIRPRMGSALAEGANHAENAWATRHENTRQSAISCGFPWFVGCPWIEWEIATIRLVRYLHLKLTRTNHVQGAGRTAGDLHGLCRR